MHHENDTDSKYFWLVTRDSEFESQHDIHFYGRVTQLGEYLICIQDVAGSSPVPVHHFVKSGSNLDSDDYNFS